MRDRRFAVVGGTEEYVAAQVAVGSNRRKDAALVRVVVESPLGEEY